MVGNLGKGDKVEEWKDVPEFPGYRVSSLGAIVNDTTDNQKTPSTNQQGIKYIGFIRGGKQHSRSVAVLVAEAFLPPPPEERFNTIIHLNGDKSDCRSSNLAWRPRSFALAYHTQFNKPYKNHIDRPIRIVETDEIFSDSLKLAKHLGVQERLLVMAVLGISDVRHAFPQDYTYALV